MDNKAKAEGGVSLAELFIIARLRNARFTRLAELNVEIARQVCFVNERLFKWIEGSRRSLFTPFDRRALRPLPGMPPPPGRRHVRLYCPGFTTDPAHMPDPHWRHGSGRCRASSASPR